MLQKASIYISSIVAAFLLLSSIPSQAQESDKGWAVGANFHNISSFRNYNGINLTLERDLNDRFSTTVSSSYYFKIDVKETGFGYTDVYDKSGAYLGVFLKSHLFSFKFCDFYGKAGLSHFLTNLEGTFTFRNDAPPYDVRVTEYDRTEIRIGPDFGFGFEVEYKVILTAEASIVPFSKNGGYFHFSTGLKVPF
ncbi:MAG: hypothetical protein CL670_16510 [Balneola sp.]|jgi:hypothetical protein|nr:hypothetical protein [Balneola sp.]MBE80764.1 hypothetical protein [Balneola sp.]HBX65298.1 hypothetical protein [Balneolaceae bacterium]|tara:strand:- start:99 stop:680 length:582 start_codon:yes stop_codon:yes gene_type:complete